MNEKMLVAIKNLRESSKKRKFAQTFDAIVSLKELDLKKPESKINEDVALPHGKGKESNVLIFSDSVKTDKAQVYSGGHLELLTRNKRAAKNAAKSTDFILADAKLMSTVGRILGQYLGPKGKIPKVLTGDVNALIENLKKSVKVRVKDSPVIQCPLGNENMTDQQVAENLQALLNFVEKRLPKGKSNIGKVEVKLTMSKPTRVEL